MMVNLVYLRAGMGALDICASRTCPSPSSVRDSVRRSRSEAIGGRASRASSCAIPRHRASPRHRHSFQIHDLGSEREPFERPHTLGGDDLHGDAIDPGVNELLEAA